ncbi:MAG: hypothetical protein KME13_15660 [Myxacorys californica WJT36-NPBG1]|jgi:hypothetical protein|nr:hypothetical protein [Myxacorys californica WJT36-NPBG1]
MSEAEIPNNSSNLFESNPDQDASQPTEEGIAAIAPQTDEEWTTVDFPDAIPVDALPYAEPTDPSELGKADRIQELERQNGELQEYVSSLEAALAHSEILRQSETERLETLAGAQYASAQQRSREHVALIAKLRKDLDFAGQRIREQDVQIVQRTQELVTAQEHLTQLFQELENAHQSAQKQQILVETLTAQLESSQEQVAQLERECALTQQRYSEQLQGTRQAEILCRDLRSRLHRQQRYTLQFKAALEKCLDAPAHAPVHLPEQVELVDEEGDLSDSSIAFVKSQPVQPWSASPGFPTFDADETTLEEQVTSRDQASWTAELLAETSWMTDLPSDSFELSEGQSLLGSTLQASHDSMAALHSLEDELNAAPRTVRAQAPQSFVERSSEDCVIAPIPKANALSYTIKHASSELADLQRGIQLFTPPEMPPVLRAGKVQRTAEVQRPAPISLEPTASSEQSDRFVAEGIAAQLDAIDRTGDDRGEVAVSDDPAAQDGLEVDQLEIGKLCKVDEPASTSLDANAMLAERNEESKNEESKSASFVTFENHAQGSSPFITLNSSGKQSVPLEQAGVAASSGNAPSPVVYPTRSQKKLPSLAAVDLPSFPKKVGR